jgi:hypothetical protein
MTIAYFAWIGTIYLLILTYKDYKNNMKVDDRHNHFMLGIAVSLLSHIMHKWYYLITLSLVCMGIFYFINKYELLGEADAKTIAWIFLGLGIINVYYLVWWSVFFIPMLLLYWHMKRFVFKIEKPTPFYIIILFSFVLNSLLQGLYIR